MRTTIDIPDAMLRQVKAKCALEGRTMRSLALVFFNDWLHDGTASDALLRAASATAESPNLVVAREPGPGETFRGKSGSIRDLPMIGMWKDREDMGNPREWIERMRDERRKRLFQ